MEATKILIVEDDPYLGMMVQELLSTRGFEVEWSKNGVDGYEQFISFEPELCIFDINMPQKDGFTLAKEVKAIQPNMPIIFLTAKSMKEDVLEGFAIGADDYVKKPFSMEELIARIQVILRRLGNSQSEEKKNYEIGAFIFHYPQRLLKNENSEQVLTHREADLLQLLCQPMGKLLERTFTLKKLWGDDTYFNARSMDVHITNLRKKLKADSSIQIVNVRGKGYKLVQLEKAPFG